MTTDRRHRQPVAGNWLAKVPAPRQPDQGWVADIHLHRHRRRLALFGWFA